MKAKCVLLGLIVCVLMMLASACCAQSEPYLYEITEDIFQVRVKLTGVREFSEPLTQYRLTRTPLTIGQVQSALQQAGITGVTVSKHRFVDGGLMIQRQAKSDVFMDVEGSRAPAYTHHDAQAFSGSLAVVTRVLNALAWPRMPQALTCLTANDLAQYQQDCLGPGTLRTKEQVLDMLFATTTADGKTFLSFQSMLNGYPLAARIVPKEGQSIGGNDVAGTLSNWLLGPKDTILCAFVPFPYMVKAQQDMQGSVYDWRDAIPAIMMQQMNMYRSALAHNRDFFPNIDAFWAQNKTTIHLSVKAVEPAYRVYADGNALPVWQVCVQADFVHSGDEPLEIVRQSMPDIEEQLYYVDAQTGRILQ